MYQLKMNKWLPFRFYFYKYNRITVLSFSNVVRQTHTCIQFITTIVGDVLKVATFSLSLFHSESV